MEEKLYACMKVDDTRKVGIVYILGKFYVAEFVDAPHGRMFFPIRTYKTISGAERFLLNRFSEYKDTYYSREADIKKGNYPTIW